MLAEMDTLFVVAGAGHGNEVFIRVLPFALLGVVVLVLLHLVVFRSRWRPAGRLSLWGKLVYLATLISVAALSVTAFGSLLRFGTLDGWPLFAHMFGAGALVALLPLLALTWGAANGIGGAPRAQATQEGPPRFFWFSKLMYWVILAGGLVVTMTMLLSMLPLFGTDGLRTLLDIHRWSGLAVVLAAILHCYSLLRRRLWTR
jgi:hypothetical protein